MLSAVTFQIKFSVLCPGSHRTAPPLWWQLCRAPELLADLDCLAGHGKAGRAPAGRIIHNKFNPARLGQAMPGTARPFARVEKLRDNYGGVKTPQ